MKIVGRDPMADVVAFMNGSDTAIEVTFEEGASKASEVEVSAAVELLSDVGEEWRVSFPMDVRPGDTTATVHKRAMARSLRMLANLIEGVNHE